MDPCVPVVVRTVSPSFGTWPTERDSILLMPVTSSTTCASPLTDTGCAPPPRTPSRSGTWRARRPWTSSDQSFHLWERRHKPHTVLPWLGPPMDPLSTLDTLITPSESGVSQERSRFTLSRLNSGKRLQLFGCLERNRECLGIKVLNTNKHITKPKKTKTRDAHSWDQMQLTGLLKMLNKYLLL